MERKRDALPGVQLVVALRFQCVLVRAVVVVDVGVELSRGVNSKVVSNRLRMPLARVVVFRADDVVQVPRVLGLVIGARERADTPPLFLDTLFQPLKSWKPMVSVFETGIEVRAPKCQ